MVMKFKTSYAPVYLRAPVGMGAIGEERRCCWGWKRGQYC